MSEKCSLSSKYSKNEHCLYIMDPLTSRHDYCADRNINVENASRELHPNMPEVYSRQTNFPLNYYKLISPSPSQFIALSNPNFNPFLAQSIESPNFNKKSIEQINDNVFIYNPNSSFGCPQIQESPTLEIRHFQLKENSDPISTFKSHTLKGSKNKDISNNRNLQNPERKLRIFDDELDAIKRELNVAKLEKIQLLKQADEYKINEEKVKDLLKIALNENERLRKEVQKLRESSQLYIEKNNLHSTLEKEHEELKNLFKFTCIAHEQKIEAIKLDASEKDRKIDSLNAKCSELDSVIKQKEQIFEKLEKSHFELILKFQNYPKELENSYFHTQGGINCKKSEELNEMIRKLDFKISELERTKGSVSSVKMDIISLHNNLLQTPNIDHSQNIFKKSDIEINLASDSFEPNKHILHKDYSFDTHCLPQDHSHLVNSLNKDGLTETEDIIQLPKLDDEVKFKRPFNKEAERNLEFDISPSRKLIYSEDSSNSFIRSKIEAMENKPFNYQTVKKLNYVNNSLDFTNEDRECRNIKKASNALISHQNKEYKNHLNDQKHGVRTERNENPYINRENSIPPLSKFCQNTKNRNFSFSVHNNYCDKNAEHSKGNSDLTMLLKDRNRSTINDSFKTEYNDSNEYHKLDEYCRRTVPRTEICYPVRLSQISLTEEKFEES
jgi:hypothetical protein